MPNCDSYNFLVLEADHGVLAAACASEGGGTVEGNPVDKITVTDRDIVHAFVIVGVDRPFEWLIPALPSKETGLVNISSFFIHE